MPVPPPVIMTVFPLAESSGREGERDGYVLSCQVEVGDGNGAIVVLRCGGRCGGCCDERGCCWTWKLSPGEEKPSYMVEGTAICSEGTVQISEADYSNAVCKGRCVLPSNKTLRRGHCGWRVSVASQASQFFLYRMFRPKKSANHITSELVHADKTLSSFDIGNSFPVCSEFRPVQFAMYEADVQSVLRCDRCKKPFDKGK